MIYTRLPAGSVYVEMVIYTAAGKQQITLFTRQPCVHIKYLFTQQPFKVQNRLYTRLPYMFFKNGYLHGSHSRAISAIYMFAGVYFADREYLCRNGYLHGRRESAENVIYTAAVCPHKIFIYTAAVKAPNRLYTRLPYMFFKNGYLHGSHSRAISAIYMFAGVYFADWEYLCQNGYLHGRHQRVKLAIFTTTGSQQKSLFTRQPCVHTNYLFKGQPFKCQIGCIHGCRICFQKKFNLRASLAIYMFAGVHSYSRIFIAKISYRIGSRAYNLLWMRNGCRVNSIFYLIHGSRAYNLLWMRNGCRVKIAIFT